ncbi:MAG: hypothetical protein IKY23_09565 [Lachnospiraceae bacterium]|nr:hypothetical protein [Lachnospiraceae bacterium]
MSRWEFMRQLEELLSDISPAEREEALQYYNDYLNDAGKENEQDVIAALGTPEQVAAIVKDGLAENAQGAFTDNGFVNGSVVQNEVINRDNITSGGQYAGSTTQTETKEKEKLPTWAIVLLVIGGIILSPVIIGLATSALGAIFSAFAAVIGIAFAFVVVTIALFVAAFVLVGIGIGNMFNNPLLALGLIGVGFVLAAISILFMVLAYLLFSKGVPALVKGVKWLWHKLTDKKEGNGNE